MLHILLTILEVIGIIILSILGILLFLVACILFVPIRYSGRIRYDGKLYIDGKLTYLLNLISVYFHKDSDKEAVSGLRILFFKFGRKSDKQKKSKVRKSKPKKKRKSSKNEIREKEKKDENLSVADNTESDKINESAETTIDSEMKATEENTEAPSVSDSATEKKEKISLITRIKLKIKSIFLKIKYLIKSFYDTILKVTKSASAFKSFISAEETKEAFVFVKGKLFKLLKHIRPRKIKGYVHFGFEDPSVTGKLLGVIYIILRGNRKSLRISPDFENKCFEEDLYVKGHIRLVHVLIIGIQLYLNENLKNVIEKRRT